MDPLTSVQKTAKDPPFSSVVGCTGEGHRMTLEEGSEVQGGDNTGARMMFAFPSCPSFDSGGSNLRVSLLEHLYHLQMPLLSWILTTEEAKVILVQGNWFWLACGPWRISSVHALLFNSVTEKPQYWSEPANFAAITSSLSSLLNFAWKSCHWHHSVHDVNCCS